MTKTATGGALKNALLIKTATRKASLKVATETCGVAAKVTQKDLLPLLTVEQRPLGSLKPATQRVRKPKPSLVKTLVANIAANGFVVPVLVRGDELVDGHSRLEAAKALVLPTVPVIDLVHLSPAQCKLVMVAVNRTAELGEWDLDHLREVIIELDADSFDLSLTGFTMPEIDIIKLDGEPDPSSALNEVPEPTSLNVTMVGDLWQLGKHLLLCGSATEQDSYNLLLGAEQVMMILTDPPYNVKIDGNVSGLGKKKHGEFVEATGEMSDAAFLEWLYKVCLLLKQHLSHASVAMLFMDWRHIGDLMSAGRSAGLSLINMVVWDKQRGGMGGVYRSAHELVAVFCNGSMTPAVNNIKLGANGRDRTNLWSYPGATTPGSSAAKMLAHHPTPKPVELLVDAMLDVTHAGDLVLDPFLGSGSTIIAGEECGRRVRGIELDPKYVDVAVRRWEQVTGQRAVLTATGQSFAAVAEERSGGDVDADTAKAGHG
ncbi:DNA modification methylase [Sphingomonas rubra]|uniref:Methyltransferase n=1 Tax=Sphingomonas rubra TaxID=634430 RepID=A0A1I5TSC3_9SPHN|nr:DNA modification methylase [Sphingomonas rubra]SFP85969.1 DNA modification methylase [Sphingomonas rubra]